MTEQQEKEKKRGKRRHLSPSYFHEDLISEVLLRLAAKSVAKSRCVSKLWSSITTLPCFIRSFEARSSKSPCLLLLLEEGSKLFVFSLAQDQNSNNNNNNKKLVVVNSYAIASPQGCSFLSAQSVNGLICGQGDGDPQIWNPTTRRFSTLPNPESSWSSGSVSFLGYDPIDGTYKVLALPCEPVYLCSTVCGNPVHILYFDPKGNSFRKVVVEGVADDHFRRLYGFGDEPLDIIRAYPNHIESLMSPY
ncbi:putative F-box protein At1g47730 [Eutrema salsugineum]|uniref:putative F-box protein At1g47730 n=1 Tax=Eutrema salsugineum TaxID=72664 RepID=UPI000CED5F66|nr:putative F-box protein At1g47730 [Eutrema salsugineum]